MIGDCVVCLVSEKVGKGGSLARVEFDDELDFDGEWDGLSAGEVSDGNTFVIFVEFEPLRCEE